VPDKGVIFYDETGEHVVRNIGLFIESNGAKKYKETLTEKTAELFQLAMIFW
jgi:hypothetical protein